MFKKLALVLAVALACVAPSPAMAAEGSLVDSFGNGVGAWTEQQKAEPENEGLESDDVLLRDGEGEQEETGVLGYIQQYVNGAKYELNGYQRPLFGATGIRLFLVIVVPVAVLFVFFWWGVRKALRSLMAAFRNGRMSV